MRSAVIIRTCLSAVLAGRSASKDARKRVYVPAIHVLLRPGRKTWMPGIKPGMTNAGPSCHDC